MLLYRVAKRFSMTAAVFWRPRSSRRCSFSSRAIFSLRDLDFLLPHALVPEIFVELLFQGLDLGDQVVLVALRAGTLAFHRTLQALELRPQPLALRLQLGEPGSALPLALGQAVELAAPLALHPAHLAAGRAVVQQQDGESRQHVASENDIGDEAVVLEARLHVHRQPFAQQREVFDGHLLRVGAGEAGRRRIE